jgi:autotransporter-associated beta strand protein
VRTTEVDLALAAQLICTRRNFGEPLMKIAADGHRTFGLMTGLLVLAAAGVALPSAGQQIVNWSFNNSSTSPTQRHPNLGAATLGLTGGVTSTGFNSGSPSDGTVGNLAYQTTNYPTQGTGNRTAGLLINLDTTGFDVSEFSFDLRTSNSTAKHFAVEYTTAFSGGTTVWQPAHDGVFTSPAGDTWNLATLVSLTDPAVDNNAAFAVRVVAVFAPNGFNDALGSQGANVAYQRADANSANVYAPGGTRRFDRVAFNGTYTAPSITPRNLQWNSTSGNWNATITNTPWLNTVGNVATSFVQAGNQGDNVTFSNVAAGAVITIATGGVTPNSTTINNPNTLTFTGGNIGGTGSLTKTGAGTLILANNNTFAGGATISAGTVETRGSTPLGAGTVSIGNASWLVTTTAQTTPGNVNLTGPVTLTTDTNLTIGGSLTGSGALTKTGAGRLVLTGIGSSTGAFTFNGGVVQLNAVGALGGNANANTTATPVLTLNNAELNFAATGTQLVRTRISSDIFLNNSSITRSQLTADVGNSPSNGDSTLTSYTVAIADPPAPSTFIGGKLVVTGSSLLKNLETRTSDQGFEPRENILEVRMPVLVTAGSTLTLESINDQSSLVQGVPTGSFANTAVALRGVAIGTNNNDSLTLEAGATLATAGVGEKRIGSTSTGKAIVGLGSSLSEATLKLDGRTFLTDKAALDSNNTLLVVSGSGTGGLRVEAPMLATYPGLNILGTAGLFGTSFDITDPDDTLGNSYTVMSPNRYAAISGYASGPAVAANGTPIVRGGTLTLAATDATAATGIVDNGPTDQTAVKLGFDTAATSAAHTFALDANANDGKLNNFGGLVIRDSNAKGLTVRLDSAVNFNGAGTLTQLGGTVNLQENDLSLLSITVGGGSVAGSGIVSADTLSQTGGAYAIDAIVEVGSVAQTGGSISIGTAAPGELTLTSSSLVSTFTSLTIGAQGVLESNSSSFLVNYSGASPIADLIAALAGGQILVTGDFNGLPTTLALSEAADLGLAEFGGIAVDDTTVLAKYTYVGDANLDGQVDALDYERVDLAIGNTGVFGTAQGDLNGDGSVDALDYEQIDLNIGNGVGSPLAGGVAAVFIPEPASLSLVALAAGLLGRRRRA